MMTFRIDFNISFLNFGVLDLLHSEMSKVRKIAKTTISPIPKCLASPNLT